MEGGKDERQKPRQEASVEQSHMAGVGRERGLEEASLKVAFTGRGLGVRDSAEQSMTSGGGWWCSLFLEGTSRRSGSAVVSSGDVELGCDVVCWRCLGDPQERSSRQQLPAEKHRGHACLPCDTECRSLLGCSTAGHAPGPGQRTPLHSSTGLLSAGAPLQHSGGATCPHLGHTASHHSAGPGRGPRRLGSGNHGTSSYWHVQGPLGSTRDGGAVPLESG